MEDSGEFPGTVIDDQRSELGRAPTREVLANLLARAQRATGPDCELDEQIALRVAGLKPTLRIGHEVLGNLRDVPARSPRYTGSVDAALGLAAQVLPGWNGSLHKRHDGLWVGEIYGAKVSRKLWEIHYGAAAFPALALCAAILTALRDGAQVASTTEGSADPGHEKP